MATTLPADFAFAPKVWADHIAAYFDKLLVAGAMASVDRTLTSRPGTTVNFPYFKAIGAAQKPSAVESLTPDKMQDDSFSCTVSEVGKAVAIRDAAFMASAAEKEAIMAEAQRQIARVMAEQVDADLYTEMNSEGNYTSAFLSADATETLTVQRILRAKVNAFGDKHEHAVAIYMHSQHFLSAFSDTNQGFLKADATDPMYGRPGWQGRLLGMNVFITDQCPRLTDIGGKQVYASFIVKQNPYGILLKAEPSLEADRDILAREVVIASTQWYGVKAFHAKVNSADKRIARLDVVTELSA